MLFPPERRPRGQTLRGYGRFLFARGRPAEKRRVNAERFRSGTLDARAVRHLAENGREVYGWRLVDGKSVLVVVAIGFNSVAQSFEDFESFRRRMLLFAVRLGKLQYPVDRLIFHRREAQRKLAWAEFDCSTPETGLPGIGDRQ